MPLVAVRCKGCGVLLPTGVRTGWVARPVLGARAVACGACGLRAEYHGLDYHLVPPAAREPGGRGFA